VIKYSVTIIYSTCNIGGIGLQLKRLEIQGFKSFANKIEINFESGITGVVGPNGSGKSNISDSIRWVLGEQSAKTLRGSKMEDIIFSGTTNRKPLGMAEVSITLDNSAKTLPIDYAEVTITRRVYRSGESEYYLNKSSCRLKDVRELLMDTGIGKDGYSIIGQGKIDEILSNKSEDRRQIFEEAAGIVKYKTRKDEAEKKLSSTKDNLLRVLDILNELEGQLGPLEKQSIKAKKFKVLKEKLLKLEINLFIKEIDKIDGEMKHIYDQINVLKKSLEEQQGEKQFYDASLEELDNLINQCNVEISSKQDEYHSVQKMIEKIEGQINLKKEKSNNNELNIKRIKLEMKEIQDAQSHISIKLEQKLVDFKDICTELDKIKEHLTSEREKYDTIYSLNSQKEKDVEDCKSFIIDTINQISDRKSESKSLKTLLDTMEERRSQVSLEYDSYKERILEKDKELSLLNSNLTEIEKHSEKTKHNIIENTNLKNHLIEKLNEISNEVNQIQNKCRNKETRKNIIEEMEKEREGFNKSVKNILNACDKNKELGKGVFGAVVDLIQVPKGYEVSIETALGPALQYIVSKDENDGKRLIEYLKKHNLGRITVLPLTSIQDRYITNEERNIIKNFNDAEIAFDVITFNKEFKNIFSSLLSKVVIVQNLDKGIEIAKLLKHKFKIVTLDGDVLNIGGSLTGGSTASKSTSILGRKREQEDLIIEIGLIQDQLNIKTEEYNKLDEEIKVIADEIDVLNTNIQENRIKIATMRNSVEQGNREKNQLQNLYQHAQNEIEQIESTKQETTDRYINYEKEIKNLEVEIESAKTKVKDNQHELVDKKQQLDNTNNILTGYKVQLATVEEQKKSFLQDIDRLQQSLKDNEISLEYKDNQLKESNKINRICEEEIISLASELDDLSLKFKIHEDELKEHKSNKEIHLAKDIEFKKLSKQVESVLLELQDSMHKLDVKRTRLEMQQQSFYTKLWDEYELTYNEALSLKEEIADVSNSSKEIKGLKDQIKNLGTVNLDSVDEYEKVKERYDFLKAQQEDLNQAQESLAKVIGDMEENMQKQFIDQFEIIKENFNNVFVKLFGGGKADLILENEGNVLECGIDIIAQPPGKKLQTLSLLSGGERALTAISLLFAILLVKPSPFCILDEIEAALDDANVYRYATFLEELSKDTQFIVVTHRKGTMESANALYGITMQDSGVSSLVSVKLSDNKKEEIAS